jgi:hypothetical protein
LMFAVLFHSPSLSVAFPGKFAEKRKEMAH